MIIAVTKQAMKPKIRLCQVAYTLFPHADKIGPHFVICVPDARLAVS